MDRKKLSNTGEMIMKNDIHAGRGQDYGRAPNRGPNFINTFSSRMPTETELKQAQQSLALLKQQIRTTGGDGFAYEQNTGYQISPNRGVPDQMRRPPQARGNATLENIERKEKMLMDKIDRLNEGLNIEDDQMRRNGYNGGKSLKNEDEYYRGSNHNRADHMNNLKRAAPPVQSFPDEDRRQNNRRPNNANQREDPQDNRRNASPITNAYDRLNQADDRRYGQPQAQAGGYRTKFALEEDRPAGPGTNTNKNKPADFDDERANAFGQNKPNRFNEDAPIGAASNKHKFAEPEDRHFGGQPAARRPVPARGQPNLQEEDRPMPGNKNPKSRPAYEDPGKAWAANPDFNDEDFAPPARNNRQNFPGDDRQAGGRHRQQQLDPEDEGLAEQQNKNSRRNPNAGPSHKKPAPRNKFEDDEADDDRPLKDKDMNQVIKEAAQNDKFEDVFECPEGCGRSFKQEALEKHIKICKKVFQTKRKKFDETAMRLEGIADPNIIKQVKKKVANAPKETKPASKGASWKAQSEAFRAQIRSAAGVKLTKEEEAAVQEVMNAGLVPCPSCGRTFGEKAAKNHIPSCEQRSKANQYKKAASTTSSKNVPVKGKR